MENAGAAGNSKRKSPGEKRQGEVAAGLPIANGQVAFNSEAVAIEFFQALALTVPLSDKDALALFEYYLINYIKAKFDFPFDLIDKDSGDATFLHIAASRDFFKLIRRMLEVSATQLDSKINPNQKDSEGETAFSMLGKVDLDMCELFVRNGLSLAVVAKQECVTYEALDELLKHAPKPNGEEHLLNQLFFDAVIEPSLPLIIWLIDHLKMNPDVKSLGIVHSSYTPLMLAMVLYTQEQGEELGNVIRYLVGLNPDLVLTNGLGHTLIQHANGLRSAALVQIIGTKLKGIVPIKDDQSVFKPLIPPLVTLQSKLINFIREYRKGESYHVQAMIELRNTLQTLKLKEIADKKEAGALFIVLQFCLKESISIVFKEVFALLSHIQRQQLLLKLFETFIDLGNKANPTHKESTLKTEVDTSINAILTGDPDVTVLNTCLFASLETLDLVDRLLLAGAQLEAQDKDGYCILALCLKNHFETFKHIISKLTVNQPSMYMNKGDDTLVHIAVREGNLEALRFLQQHDAIGFANALAVQNIELQTPAQIIELAVQQWLTNLSSHEIQTDFIKFQQLFELTGSTYDMVTPLCLGQLQLRLELYEKVSSMKGKKGTKKLLNAQRAVVLKNIGFLLSLKGAAELDVAVKLATDNDDRDVLQLFGIVIEDKVIEVKPARMRTPTPTPEPAQVTPIVSEAEEEVATARALTPPPKAPKETRAQRKKRNRVQQRSVKQESNATLASAPAPAEPDKALASCEEKSENPLALPVSPPPSTKSNSTSGSPPHVLEDVSDSSSPQAEIMKSKSPSPVEFSFMLPEVQSLVLAKKEKEEEAAAAQEAGPLESMLHEPCPTLPAQVTVKDKAGIIQVKAYGQDFYVIKEDLVSGLPTINKFCQPRFQAGMKLPVRLANSSRAYLLVYPDFRIHLVDPSMQLITNEHELVRYTMKHPASLAGVVEIDGQIYLLSAYPEKGEWELPTPDPRQFMTSQMVGSTYNRPPLSRFYMGHGAMFGPRGFSRPPTQMLGPQPHYNQFGGGNQ